MSVHSIYFPTWKFAKKQNTNPPAEEQLGRAGSKSKLCRYCMRGVCMCDVWCVCVCVVCVCVMCVSVCKYGMGDCVLLFSDLTQCTCTVYCVHMWGLGLGLL